MSEGFHVDTRSPVKLPCQLRRPLEMCSSHTASISDLRNNLILSLQRVAARELTDFFAVSEGARVDFAERAPLQHREVETPSFPMGQHIKTSTVCFFPPLLQQKVTSAARRYTAHLECVF